MAFLGNYFEVRWVWGLMSPMFWYLLGSYQKIETWYIGTDTYVVLKRYTLLFQGFFYFADLTTFRKRTQRVFNQWKYLFQSNDLIWGLSWTFWGFFCLFGVFLLNERLLLMEKLDIWTFDSKFKEWQWCDNLPHDVLSNFPCIIVSLEFR